MTIDYRRCRLPSMEASTEVVKRALSRSELPDEGVGREPDELALVVGIDAAPLGAPLLGRLVEKLRRDSCVDQWTPEATGRVVKAGGGLPSRILQSTCVPVVLWVVGLLGGAASDLANRL